MLDIYRNVWLFDLFQVRAELLVVFFSSCVDPHNKKDEDKKNKNETTCFTDRCSAMFLFHNHKQATQICLTGYK